MKPGYSIIADGSDITALIADRLVSLSVSDEAGITSDQMDLTLDDRDFAFEIPSPSAILEISMGYAETGLVVMGRYTVDEVTVSGMPATMSIRGKSADMVASFKSHKKRSWDKTTIGAIVSKIAGEHGLKAAVAPEFAGVKIDHLDQSSESDMHFLTRLAEDHNAIVKPAGGELVFVKRGSGVDASGKPMRTTTIDYQTGEILSWQSSYQERCSFARVGACWNNKRGAKVQTVYAGKGEPTFLIKKPFKTQAAAKAAAEAKMKRQNLGKQSLSLTCIGKATLCAEMPIDLVGAREGGDGRWICTKVEHRFDSSGFQSSIEACKPEDLEKKDDEG